MQELCSLANTGTNITIIIAAAFGFITLASLILYQLKTGKAFSRGLFSLLLMFGLLGTVVLAPLSAHAAGSDAATNCPTGSQTSNNSGGGSQASITCPENWIVVPGNSAYNTNDFCVMKYNAKQVGATITDSYELTLYTDGSYSTDGTWSIVISGPINVTVGPFPYDVDGQTVADALEAAVGESVSTNNTGRVENNNETTFTWASLDDDWNITLDLDDLEQNDGPGLYDAQILAGDPVSSGGVATSQAAGSPWVSISQTNAITASQAAAPGAHLISENEWMTIAHNVLANPANWCDPDGSNCGAAPGTAGKILANGHNDSTPNQALAASTNDAEACFGTVTAGVNTPCGDDPDTQKRTLTLSNGEVIWDFAGNVWQWTSGTETRGNLPSNGGSASCCEYNADFDDWGTLAYINPAVHNPAASAWGTAEGVGILSSVFSSGSSSVVAFVRGGGWFYAPYAGAFSLYLGGEPSGSDPGLGFRAAL